MTKTLLLMRHAKSSWNNDLPDHERPLNNRGKREAEQMGQELVRLGRQPDLIITSTAKRARSTAKRVARELDDASVVSDSRLYETTPRACLRVLAERGQGNTVLLIAHNPTLEDLVRDLVARYIGLTPATIAVIHLAIAEWSDLDFASPARLEQVLTPREAGVEALGII
ncbi:MAG: hypothetical protein GXY68_04455 [Chloroflexi bacterium]|jgi:phosphohistidine phosphatase|nr:hypothetical protein [Chloroflexota bacterium]